MNVEVLDLEDRIVGRVQQEERAVPGRGSWQEQVNLTKAISTDDLVWHRLRYRFAYNLLSCLLNLPLVPFIKDG